MKTCTKCQETKPLELFSKNGRRSDGRHPWCKVCFARYEKERYHAGDKMRKRANDEARLARNRDYVWNYLSTHPCVDCGETDWMVLELDHREQADKVKDICMLIRESGLEKIKVELDKCDVRCCNCHRRRTIDQLGWWRKDYVGVA